MLGTQTVATLIAVYGLFMTPLGWKWAGFVWAYALVWALINDRIKLLAYKIFDPVKAEPKAETKADRSLMLMLRLSRSPMPRLSRSLRPRLSRSPKPKLTHLRLKPS